jgi:hypothetical protein
MHHLKAGILAVGLTLSLYAADTTTLQLDVYAWRLQGSVAGKAEPGYSVLEVHSIVTNVGTKAVTLPTNSYKGEPDALSSGDDWIRFSFFVGYGELGGKRLVPSPHRYFPVTLQPGECTELPFIEADVSEIRKFVDVSFSVDEDYATPQGWWSGRLHKKVKIGEGDSPYFEKAKPGLGIPPKAKEPNHPAEPASPSKTGSP